MFTFLDIKNLEVSAVYNSAILHSARRCGTLIKKRMKILPAINTDLSSGEVTLTTPARNFSYHFAAEYFDRGWSVIPLTGKRPALSSWREFQTKRASLDQVREWFGESSANMGIVTGRLSELVVVDCDSAKDAEYWRQTFPKTPLAVRTGGGGTHFYYRYPADETIGNRAGLLSRRIDLRAEGGYVAAPPSLHPSGSDYQWLSGSDYRLSDMPYFSPEWIIDKNASRSAVRSVEHPRSYIRSIRAISGKGGHNQTFRAACILRDAGLTPEESLYELILWNETHASPPWSARELLHKVQSAFQSSDSPLKGTDFDE